MNEMRKLMEAVEQLDEIFSDQDPTQLKTEEDFFNRIIALTDEGDALLNSNDQIGKKFRVLDQILQDISNITRLRQAGRDYEDVEEGKYNYDKKDKGKGAGITSPMYDGGADNRKNRKAFRKAEKAKAHQARMRGELDEDSIQLNEYNIDDFSNEDLITQLAQNIAEDTMRNMKLTHKGADNVRRIAPAWAEGMAARLVNDLHNEINVEIQVLIDDFVDDDSRDVVD